MSRATELLDAATPLPWQLYAGGDGDWFITEADPATEISKVENYDRKEVATGWTSPVENAALIVYAVNRLPDYEAAVEALETCIETFADGLGSHKDGPFCSLTDEGHDAITIGRAALARLRDGVLA